jgi:hypothetical protein
MSALSFSLPSRHGCRERNGIVMAVLDTATHASRPHRRVGMFRNGARPVLQLFSDASTAGGAAPRGWPGQARP